MKELIGKIVDITGKHQYAGHRGKVIDVQEVSVIRKNGWVVRLTDGHEVFVFDRSQLITREDHGSN